MVGYYFIICRSTTRNGQLQPLKTIHQSSGRNDFTYTYNIVDDNGKTVSTVTFSPATILIHIIYIIYFMLFDTENVFSAQQLIMAQLLNG